MGPDAALAVGADMPELPEVETIARHVRPALVGRRIAGLRAAWVRSLGGARPRSVARAVLGATLASVGRRGKFVVLALERGGVPAGGLYVHLRMSGRLHVDPRSAPPRPYQRVGLELDDGNELRFVDVRKFGRFVFAREAAGLVGELGPEPLGTDFTAAWLARGLAARRRRLKPLLLDQTFVAGLGNIYVDESLFRAGLHPLTRSDRISPAGSRRLWRAIQSTLAEAIEREGSSFDAFYVTPEGQPGSYQEEFRVYGRDGEPCRRCGTTIERLVIGQRGTHICPRCQPRP
jgi:formamidopyrimidine-DNA glycosylase